MILALFLSIAAASPSPITRSHCVGQCDRPPKIIYPNGFTPKQQMMADMTNGISKAVSEYARSNFGAAQAITGAKVPCSEGKAAEYACSNVDLLSYLPHTDMGDIEGNDGRI